MLGTHESDDGARTHRVCRVDSLLGFAERVQRRQIRAFARARARAREARHIERRQRLDRVLGCHDAVTEAVGLD